MTNFEKMVSKLTVEEVANPMSIHFEFCDGCLLEETGCCDYYKLCEDDIKEWLNKEAEEE